MMTLCCSCSAPSCSGSKSSLTSSFTLYGACAVAIWAACTLQGANDKLICSNSVMAASWIWNGCSWASHPGMFSYCCWLDVALAVERGAKRMDTLPDS